MNRMTEIAITKLCKSFGKHQVLRDVDWSIATGTVVGLLGTNERERRR